MNMHQLRELAYLKNEMKAIYSVIHLKILAYKEFFEDQYELYEAFDFIEENFKPKSLTIQLHDIDFDYLRIPECITSLQVTSSGDYNLLKHDDTLVFARTIKWI